MLQITIPPIEYYDEATNRFFTKGQTQVLNLEHSLISISKWEAKWKKPYIPNSKKVERTLEEAIDYIKCMTLNQNVDDEVYYRIPAVEIQRINEYINDPMTATIINEGPSSKKGKKFSEEFITSELIYYWMITLNIPVEFQKWHINRLLTLIKVCTIKNTPQKKMSKSDLFSRNKALNDARRKAMHSKG